MSGRQSLRDRIMRRFQGRKAWQTWLGISAVMLLIVIAFVRIIWRELPAMNLAELFTRLSMGELIAAVVMYSIDLGLAIISWSLIVGRISGLRSIAVHARIFCATNITRRLPGTFWYLLGRAVLYERQGVPRSVSVVAGGIEYAVQIVAALVVALATWPLLFSAQTLNPLWLIVPLLLLGALLNPPVLQRIIRRLSPNLDLEQIRYRDLLIWIASMALTWVGGGLILFILTNAVVPLPLSALPGIIGVWATSGVVAITLFSLVPFGFAVNELTLATMLSLFIPGGEALFVALLIRGLLTVCEVSYGLIGFIASLPDLRMAPEAETSAEMAESRILIPENHPHEQGK